MDLGQPLRDLRAWGDACRAYRIRRPIPLPLSDDELSTVRTLLYLVLGKRSLLVHPQRQLERVPRLIPDARAEIISGTGHGPQIDHVGEVNRRMLEFMAFVDSHATRGSSPA